MKSYLVEFVVLEPRGSPVALRQLLTKRLPWARDLAVARAGDLFRVHVRTGRPELAVATGVECGVLKDIVVESEDVRSVGG